MLVEDAALAGQERAFAAHLAVVEHHHCCCRYCFLSAWQCFVGRKIGASVQAVFAMEGESQAQFQVRYRCREGPPGALHQTWPWICGKVIVALEGLVCLRMRDQICHWVLVALCSGDRSGLAARGASGSCSEAGAGRCQPAVKMDAVDRCQGRSQVRHEEDCC